MNERETYLIEISGRDVFSTPVSIAKLNVDEDIAGIADVGESEVHPAPLWIDTAFAFNRVSNAVQLLDKC